MRLNIYNAGGAFETTEICDFSQVHKLINEYLQKYKLSKCQFSIRGKGWVE